MIRRAQGKGLRAQGAGLRAHLLRFSSSPRLLPSVFGLPSSVFLQIHIVSGKKFIVKQ